MEHYGRIVRALQKNMPVKIDLEIRNTFHEDDTASFNVVAEIPGHRPKDEVVMLGGHIDSWHGGTGATDNAAGWPSRWRRCASSRRSGLKPRRTVRIALWSGEEQGLLGSRAYVSRSTSAERAPTMDARSRTTPSSPAYFNLDNGTGKIRGVYLQGNEAVAADLPRGWSRSATWARPR